MKFFPLVLANLGRHKRRVFLTISSVALALFLFAILSKTVTATMPANGPRSASRQDKARASRWSSSQETGK